MEVVPDNNDKKAGEGKLPSAKRSKEKEAADDAESAPVQDPKGNRNDDENTKVAEGKDAKAVAQRDVATANAGNHSDTLEKAGEGKDDENSATEKPAAPDKNEESERNVATLDEQEKTTEEESLVAEKGSEKVGLEVEEENPTEQKSGEEEAPTEQETAAGEKCSDNESIAAVAGDSTECVEENKEPTEHEADPKGLERAPIGKASGSSASDKEPAEREAAVGAEKSFANAPPVDAAAAEDMDCVEGNKESMEDKAVAADKSSESTPPRPVAAVAGEDMDCVEEDKDATEEEARVLNAKGSSNVSPIAGEKIDCAEESKEPAEQEDFADDERSSENENLDASGSSEGETVGETKFKPSARKKLFTVAKKVCDQVDGGLKDKELALVRKSEWCSRPMVRTQHAVLPPPLPSGDTEVEATAPTVDPFTLCVPIKKSIWIADAKDMSYIPDLTGCSPEADTLSFHTKKRRKRIAKYGADCEQAANTARRRAVLEGVSQSIDTSAFSEKQLNAVVDAVTRRPVPPSPPPKDAPVAASTSSDNPYEDWANSHTTMWCSRCFIYDCNFHSVSQHKLDLAAQNRLALQKERTDCWKKPSEQRHNQEFDHPAAAEAAEAEVSPLTMFQTTIAKELFILFEGNVDLMAHVMGAQKERVEEYCNAQKLKVPIVPKTTRRKDTSSNYYSVKNYNQATWSAYRRDAKVKPMFEPCVHEGPCSLDEECRCIASSNFCTHACSQGSASKNFFRGCDCKGDCSTEACTCASASRECDPALCKCGMTCCDDSGKRQHCKNSNILMGRGVPLLLGPSTVSGYGIFAKHDIPKGTFVGEYVGEAISQDEAERRGRIADARKSTYLLMLATDVCIDSLRKGGLTRCINHPSQGKSPNLSSETKFVRGEQHVGFYAIKDIPAQDELFFNYDFTLSYENEFVQKGASMPHWMAGDSKQPAKRRRKS